MSLFGSLFTGVSALGAQSQSLGMIYNNIANVNTTGYKRNYASFASMVTQDGRSSTYAPGGVRTNTQTTINQQGNLQQTGSKTDAAIAGSGFFVVKRDVEGTQETMFTRAGSFSEDARGLLRNTSGFYLMGWRLDNQGNLPAGSADVNSLQPVDVAFLNGLTAPTTEAEIALNLDANQSLAMPGPHFSRSMTVYDSLGGAQTLQFDFTRTAAPNTWTLQVTDPNGGTMTSPAGTMQLVFNNTNGTIDRVATQAANAGNMFIDQDGKLKIAITGLDWINDSDATQAINMDIGNLTQYNSSYSLAYIDQNGAELGLRTGVSIDRNGYVVASFSNGQTRNLYKLPLAIFTNPNGLEERSGNVYIQTIDSGAYNLREPGRSGAGVIASSSLEASNVDLADEFSRMIITQRAYSAGTKVISTSDQMLSELLQLR